MAKQANEGLAPRKIVEKVLTKATADELWTINFNQVLPFTLQDFSVGSVIPAMLYMFRWGKRRGTGQFLKTYYPSPLLPENREIGEPNDEDRLPTHPVIVDHILSRLSSATDAVELPPNAAVGRAILGDALLCYCLENVRRQEGRDKPVSRVFPTHYFSSWIDLPKSVASLRMVPELLVQLLAEIPGRLGESKPYSVNNGIANNRLLSLLGRGVIEDIPGSMNLGGDRFDNNFPYALDQLLTARVALICGSAPSTLQSRGQSDIPRQQPICHRAANAFAQDFDALLEGFGTSIPRPSILPMLESCIGLGMSNLLLSTATMLRTWDRNGCLPAPSEQHPHPIFVDASSSLDPDLQSLAENSIDDCLLLLDSIPDTLSCMRVLHEQIKNDEDRPQDVPSDSSDATAWLNFLGSLLTSEESELSRSIRKEIARTSLRLADELSASDHFHGIAELLRQTKIHPARRLGHAIIRLMGDKLQNVQVKRCFDSCLMADQPNGWMRTRDTRRKDANGRSIKKVQRSLVLTNTALEFLVHRHLYDSAEHSLRPLSLNAFLDVLRDRYGFCVDTAPPGLRVAGELLDRNRRILENRLRDLGLLVSVNDAKSMKRLQSRYSLSEKTT